MSSLNSCPENCMICRIATEALSNISIQECSPPSQIFGKALWKSYNLVWKGPLELGSLSLILFRAGPSRWVSRWHVQFSFERFPRMEFPLLLWAACLTTLTNFFFFFSLISDWNFSSSSLCPLCLLLLLCTSKNSLAACSLRLTAN